MKKNIGIGVLICALGFVTSVAAEVPLAPSEYQDHPAVSNNTGALSTVDAAANIATESGGSVGAAEGEITIHFDGTGIKVYSGLNKVEVIPEGSDGWSGAYNLDGSIIKFRPTGRPELNCQQQDTSPQWYGPCKLPEVAG